MQLACETVREPATPTQVLYGLSRRAVICGVQVNHVPPKSGNLSYHISGRLWCKGMQPYDLRVQRRTCVAMASLSETEARVDSKLPGGQYKIPTFGEATMDAVRTYPWEKLSLRFLQRTMGLAWIVTKWLAIPVFALSTLSELVYTLSKAKDICIPLGILSGVLLAKVLGNASLDVMKEFQDRRAALPLILLGLFFLLLKLPGPYYPSWAAVFIPHVANAGLVKTVFLFSEWQKTSV